MENVLISFMVSATTAAVSGVTKTVSQRKIAAKTAKATKEIEAKCEAGELEKDKANEILAGMQKKYVKKLRVASCASALAGIAVGGGLGAGYYVICDHAGSAAPSDDSSSSESSEDSSSSDGDSTSE
jgi:hypothetical protein